MNAHKFGRKARRAVVIALAVVIAVSSAFAGLVVTTGDGIVATALDGITYNGPSGIVATALDGLL
ncbi:MAG TPA: hypothetical protein VIM99_10675, partial [Blastocatellia bacterium]